LACNLQFIYDSRAAPFEKDIWHTLPHCCVDSVVDRLFDVWYYCFDLFEASSVLNASHMYVYARGVHLLRWAWYACKNGIIPSTALPYLPSSPAEQLAAYSDTSAVTTRMIAAASQIMSIVQKPCDAIIGVSPNLFLPFPFALYLYD
jgi:hypothetical protein